MCVDLRHWLIVSYVDFTGYNAKGGDGEEGEGLVFCCF